MALLVLAANYSVHLFWAPRFCYPEWAIMMNICTYFIAAWLFGSSMLQLLSKNYNSPRRDLTNIVAWLTFCATAITTMLLTPRGMTMYVALCVFSIVFMLYTIRLATDLIRTYRRAIRLLDDYYSDDTKAYVRWMSVFTWLAVFYGVGQGLFTFIPDRYVFLWILSSIPFYTYGYISYTNYSLDVQQVDVAIEIDETPKTVHDAQPGAKEDIAGDKQLARRLNEWVEQKGFAQQCITIAQLAQSIGTNRTYVSSFINSRYKVSFRDWINALRIDYAKELLHNEPDTPIGDIARRTGYSSGSTFSRIFTINEGITPSQWRKMPLDN